MQEKTSLQSSGSNSGRLAVTAAVVVVVETICRPESARLNFPGPSCVRFASVHPQIWDTACIVYSLLVWRVIKMKYKLASPTS